MLDIHSLNSWPFLNHVISCKIQKINFYVTVLGTFMPSIIILYCIGLEAKLDFDPPCIQASKSTPCLKDNGFRVNFIGTLKPRLMI